MTDPKSQTPLPPKRLRIFLWLTLTTLGLILLLGIVLLALSAYVNSTGRIPDELRTKPAAIAAILTRPAPTPTPVPTYFPDMATQISANADLAKRDAHFNAVFQIDRLGNEFLNRIMSFGPGKLTSAQVSWLEAHASELRTMHDLIRSADPIIFSNRTNPDNRIFLWTSMMSLDARRLIENADYPGTRERFLDTFRYLDLNVGHETRDFVIYQFQLACSVLKTAIQDPEWPGAEWGGIGEALEKLDAALFDPEAIRNEQIEAYLAQRANLITRLDAPWYEPFFGLPNDDRDYYYNTGYYWPIIGDEIQPPKLRKYMQASATAIANKKRSAESLKNFDAEKQRIIQRFYLTYPERNAGVDAAEKEMKKHQDNCFFDIQLTQADAAANSFMIHENTVHLARVGLLWRLDRDKAKSIRGEKLTRHNPWRDPFSEQPYFVEETSTGTLIYGQGWRLKPEDGRRYHNLQIFCPDSPI
ncbi:MAG: hypothetical protein ABFD69_11545 [Candidatus Sumerlaeia bacterium]